ncbi:HIT domain-containing protein [Streptomyces sp. NBC_01443]|uniref:HIT family protein n=1 Tax=Streptomyces sp. NBC_01443 TaxID=2903868 RepID=UPI002258D466|nr:HIT domain-containing protein [Streptomyces sp. NBC_01443]MCX4632798.1 HIT domain-containing protein [Streptomyces sp. NBC_01443]
MTSSPTPAGPPELAAGRWPEQFEEHMAGIGCPMCGNDFGAQDIGWGILLHRGEVANAYLWRSGQIRGYCVLIYRDAHVAEPTQLPDAAAAAFSRETLALGRAIEADYRPLKTNYCTLGNVLPHLHTHVNPRYTAGVDPGPGGPLPFTFLDEGRQQEEQLQHDAARLRLLLDPAICLTRRDANSGRD